MKIKDIWSKNIGHNLRQARRSRNFTQDELATLTGLKRQTISWMERRGRRMTIPNLMTVCDVLGIDVIAVIK